MHHYSKMSAEAKVTKFGLEAMAKGLTSMVHCNCVCCQSRLNTLMSRMDDIRAAGLLLVSECMLLLITFLHRVSLLKLALSFVKKQLFVLTELL